MKIELPENEDTIYVTLSKENLESLIRKGSIVRPDPHGVSLVVKLEEGTPPLVLGEIEAAPHIIEAAPNAWVITRGKMQGMRI